MERSVAVYPHSKPPASFYIVLHRPTFATRNQTMTQISQTDAKKPRLVGINHIALEVGDIDQALDFYGKIFDFTLRGKRPSNAFIELGDQFINLMETPTPHENRRRHFGLVVDDRSSVRERVEAAGGRLLPGPFLDFLDPWGNRVEVVEYGNIQFTKAPHVLRAMGFELDKTETALRELADKGMAP
jgi:lactoylglutathione lyase